MSEMYDTKGESVLIQQIFTYYSNAANVKVLRNYSAIGGVQVNELFAKMKVDPKKVGFSPCIFSLRLGGLILASNSNRKVFHVEHSMANASFTMYLCICDRISLTTPRQTTIG